MKNHVILGFVLCVYGCSMQASFMGVYDSCDVNKFIDLDASSCTIANAPGEKKAQTAGEVAGEVAAGAVGGGLVAGGYALAAGEDIDFCFPTEQPLKLIIDARQHLGDLFGVNVLSPAFKNRILYVYNQFGYWTSIVQDTSKAGGFSKDKDSEGTFHAAQTSKSEQNKMKNIPEPAQGIYQIMVSACPSMVRRIAGSVQCPPGKYPVVAVLSLANADDVYPLATSVLCLAPSEQFFIEVTSIADNPTVVAPQHVLVDTLSQQSAQVVFRGDIGPSPRTISLKKK